MVVGKLPRQWQNIPITLEDLCIDTALRCGQSFRWTKTNDEWRCSLLGRIVSLRQDANHLHFNATWPDVSLKGVTVKPPTPSSDDTEALLRSYFNLQLDLRALYKKWSQDDVNFRKKAPQFSGIRILNQDPWETLVCFICSSNNNISRISRMAQALCTHYGSFIGRLDDEDYYDFPSPESLCGPGVESRLRELGFGYRAKYIAQTAETVAKERSSGWLAQLRNAECPQWPGTTPTINQQSTYRAAHEELLLLSGVGPKVADCVCLMGLGWGEAVPVDTHVWQIAIRDYKFASTRSKTFSKAMYDAVGDHFRKLWGDQAGWAQSVLFTANLKTFSSRLEAPSDDKSKTIPEPGRGRKREVEALTENIQTTSGEMVSKRTRRKRK